MDPRLWIVSPFDRLPDDLIIQILRHYNRRSAEYTYSRDSSLSLVCRRWRRLADLARTSIRLSDSSRISSSQFALAIRRFPNLTALRIRNSNFLHSVTDDHLEGIARACPGLLKLDLHFVKTAVCTERGLSALCQGCASLEELKLSYFPLDTLPAAVFSLTRLVHLKVSSARLTLVPDEIGMLHSLKALILDATRLPSLPDAISKLSSLEQLHLSGCMSLRSLPDTIGQLRRLSSFDGSPALPDSICCCTALNSLVLTQSVFAWLPEDLGKLLNLRQLKLEDCSKLTLLPSSLAQLSLLESLDIQECYQLQSLPDDIGQLAALRQLRLCCVEISTLPDSVGQLQKLESMRLDRCPLEELPTSVTQLSSLKELHIRSCSLLSLPQNMHRLTTLQRLVLKHCDILELPADLALCPSLHQVTILGCYSLVAVPEGVKRLLTDDSGEPTSDEGSNPGEEDEEEGGDEDDEDDEDWDD